MISMNADEKKQAQMVLGRADAQTRLASVGPAKNILGEDIQDITEGEDHAMDDAIMIERRKCSRHDLVEDEIKTLREEVKASRGRPSWIVSLIIAFLSGLVGVFATLHFSNSGLLNQVAGKQAMVLTELTRQADEIRRMQELVVRNAGALDSLSARIGGAKP